MATDYDKTHTAALAAREAAVKFLSDHFLICAPRPVPRQTPPAKPSATPPSPTLKP